MRSTGNGQLWEDGEYYISLSMAAGIMELARLLSLKDMLKYVGMMKIIKMRQIYRL